MFRKALSIHYVYLLQGLLHSSCISTETLQPQTLLRPNIADCRRINESFTVCKFFCLINNNHFLKCIASYFDELLFFISDWSGTL